MYRFQHRYRSSALTLALTVSTMGLFVSQSALEAQVTSLTVAQAGDTIRSGPGIKVVLLYATDCPISRATFPDVVRLAKRYSSLGARFLAFSVDWKPDSVDQFLDTAGYSYDRFHIQPWKPGELRAAFDPPGITLQANVSRNLPHIAVIDADGRLVGQVHGRDGAKRADKWLKSLGLRP